MTEFDVLIVGSGAGGGMAALRLCEQGFKVGLIEQGRRFNPRQDYILNHLDWDTRLNPLSEARQKEQTIDTSYTTQIMLGDKLMNRAPLSYHRVHGIGGSTLHYQGEAHRFPEHAFNTHSIYGWGADWPIGYQQLAPYYEQAEVILGVAGEPGNPHKAQRGAFPTPAHALSAKSQIMADAANKIGLELLPNTLALPSKSVDGRTPCQHSGGCEYGCVFQAKSSVDQAVIPKAEATGNLTLFSETKVLRLISNAQGNITGLACRNLLQGTNSALSAKRYILAGGAIETPRLLLASASTQHRNGFGNEHDQVGRYFMETVMAQRHFSFEQPFPAYTGPPLDSRIWNFAKPSDKLTSGYVLGLVSNLTPNSSPASHALKTPGIGREHKQRVRSSFGNQLFLFGIAEQVPRASNRVTLSNAHDSHGLAKLKVHCEYNGQDQYTLRRMQGTLKDWAMASSNKIKTERTSDTLLHSSATHVGGTCRMGVDPKNSVVNEFGQVHGQSNCYIADASVLVTQGAGDSPSLTIQALALRTADNIANSLKVKA